MLAILAIAFRYFGLWCTKAGNLCYGTWLDRTFLEITNPLDSFARYLLVVTLILIFVPRSTFNSWLKFAAWVLPLAFIYIAMTPVWDSSWLPFVRDDAALLAGQIFSGISLLLILYKWIKFRKVSPYDK